MSQGSCREKVAGSWNLGPQGDLNLGHRQDESEEKTETKLAPLRSLDIPNKGETQSFLINL